MMPIEPCHIEYELSRRQRLVAHLGIWAPYLVGIIPACSIAERSYSSTPWFVLVIVVIGWVARGFIAGLVNVIFVPSQHMDIVVNETGLGQRAGAERWWLFLDGIIQIKKYSKDTWTIYHHNGAVLNIPVDAIAQRYISHMRSMSEWGKTPEGKQAISDRGLMILGLEAEAKEKGRQQQIPSA